MRCCATKTRATLAGCAACRGGTQITTVVGAVGQEQVPGATARPQRDRSSGGRRRRAGVHRCESSHGLLTRLVKGHQPVWLVNLLAPAFSACQVLVSGKGDRCFARGVHRRLEVHWLEQDTLVGDMHRHRIAAALSMKGKDPAPFTVELRPCSEALHANPRALGEHAGRLLRQHAASLAQARVGLRAGEPFGTATLHAGAANAARDGGGKRANYRCVCKQQYTDGPNTCATVERRCGSGPQVLSCTRLLLYRQRIHRERKGGRKALDSVGLNLEAWIFNHCLTSRNTDKSCLK